MDAAQQMFRDAAVIQKRSLTPADRRNLGNLTAMADAAKDTLSAALAELEKAEAVYLVATGETYEGAETYTRHDVAPALCDCEKLYTAPALPSYDPLGFSYEWEYCGNWFPDFSRTRPIDSPHRRNITPLYTTPPPAKPAPDIYDAYKSWPEDIRKKLSLHDLRRMSGWRMQAEFNPLNHEQSR